MCIVFLPIPNIFQLTIERFCLLVRRVLFSLFVPSLLGRGYWIIVDSANAQHICKVRHSNDHRRGYQLCNTSLRRLEFAGNEVFIQWENASRV
jgi:hypothetical protein